MKASQSKTQFKLIGAGILVAGALISAVWSGEAASVDVSASITPAQIALGEAAQLTVNVEGRTATGPSLPNVDGLQFVSVGQSSSFQSVNGRITSSVSYIYQVSPTRTGTFNIPPIRVADANTRPLVLQVIQRAGGSPQASQNLPPPNVNWPTPQNQNEQNNSPAFLQVVVPDHKLYVGELTPIQIKAYFRRGMSASLNGVPTLSSDAFTMSKLTEQPSQTQEVVNGIPYTVVTWPAALSAVKAGDYSLNLELPVLVRVQSRSARRRDPFESFFGNSGFDDSFLDDFFGRVTEKPITLQGGLSSMTVQSLPTQGRPADFSGAVGQFQVQADVTPKSATQGDPLTLKVQITGKGNFDRVTMDGLAESPAWKSYKPSANFEPQDSLGLQGTKTFEQAVVPRQAGKIKLPEVAFSYFDPETKKYVTAHSQPVPLDITPATGASPSLAATTPNATKPAKPVSQADADGLSPNAVETGRTVGTLQPILLQPGFVAVPAASLALLAGGLWLVKRREIRAADHRRNRRAASEAAVREQVAQMENARGAGDISLFFNSARRALVERLAEVWQVSPGAVNQNEVNRRLGAAGEVICSVFRTADQTAYSGQHFTNADLEEWQRIVNDQLDALNKS